MRRIRFNWRTYSTRSLANNCMSSQVRRLAYNTALCFPPQEPTHTHRTRINAMASPCNWFHSERRCALLPSKHWQNVCYTHSLSIYTYIYIYPSSSSSQTQLSSFRRCMRHTWCGVHIFAGKWVRQRAFMCDFCGRPFFISLIKWNKGSSRQHLEQKFVNC